MMSKIPNFNEKVIINERLRNCQEHILNDIIDNTIKNIKQDIFKIKKYTNSIVLYNNYDCNETICEDDCYDCHTEDIITINVMWDIQIDIEEEKYLKANYFDTYKFKMTVIKETLDYIEQNYDELYGKLKNSNSKLLKILRKIETKIYKLHNERDILSSENKETINKIYLTVGNNFKLNEYDEYDNIITEIEDDYVTYKDNIDTSKITKNIFLNKIKNKQIIMEKNVIRKIKITKII